MCFARPFSVSPSGVLLGVFESALAMARRDCFVALQMPSSNRVLLLIASARCFLSSWTCWRASSSFFWALSIAFVVMDLEGVLWDDFVAGAAFATPFFFEVFFVTFVEGGAMVAQGVL